jgi:glycosyltransferase involved in cell wall biosynthesis
MKLKDQVLSATKKNENADLLPKVSVLIPTLNSARTLDKCLDSIVSQTYPREKIEIIIADAGSEDETKTIAKRFEADKIVFNKLKTGEAGKAAAAEAATGEIFAMIDSDNILPADDWLERMIAPLLENDIVASEPILYTHRKEDPPMTRYFAMLGMNDPLCLFIGNYDRICAITGKWTNLPVETEEYDDWIKVKIESGVQTPTIGANGFLIKRSALTKINWSPYWFDVDILRDAANASENGFVNVAKVKCGIVHLYCTTIEEFSRKQERRVRDFLYFSKERKQSFVPGEKRRTLLGVAKFTLSAITILPLLLQKTKGNKRISDEAWSLHLPVCFATLKVYSIAFIRKLLGLKQAPLSRENWRQ